MLSLAVILLCSDVVRTDASRITPDEQSFLVEQARQIEQLEGEHSARL